MSVSEILNIGSAAAGVTSVQFILVKYENIEYIAIYYKKSGNFNGVSYLYSYI